MLRLPVFRTVNKTNGGNPSVTTRTKYFHSFGHSLCSVATTVATLYSTKLFTGNVTSVPRAARLVV